jgi:hypothetical protein
MFCSLSSYLMPKFQHANKICMHHLCFGIASCNQCDNHAWSFSLNKKQVDKGTLWCNRQHRLKQMFQILNSNTCIYKVFILP